MSSNSFSAARLLSCNCRASAAAGCASAPAITGCTGVPGGAFMKPSSIGHDPLITFPLGNADYASIITPRHHARLRTMLQQAQTQGAEVQTIDPTDGKPMVPTVGTLGDGASRQMLPTLVFGATSQMQLMQEEIFGPILPVISYERLDDAIAHINAGPRPLALYWFGQSEAVRDDVLARTVSGGVTVNDTLMHVAHDNLPFGGVGD
eukprot:gene18755-26535_t